MDENRERSKQKAKRQLDEFQGNVKVPFHLSLPFYVFSVYLFLLGFFILLHWFLAEYVADSSSLPLFTSERKVFGPLDSMQSVRWKYYIPKIAFGGSPMGGVYTILAGGLFIFLHKVCAVKYAKKRVAEESAGKR